MYKKPIYKYRDNEGNTIISPYKPECEYEEMYRLIAHSDDYFITNYSVFTSVIDVTAKDLELWFEVHKDNLNDPVSIMGEIEKLEVLNDEQDALIIELASQLSILKLTL